MALPIFPTPPLSGKDAEVFVERITKPGKRPAPVKVDAAKVRENILRARSEQKQL